MIAKNKIGLVTGGSRGLGRDMVMNLAKKGIDVVFTFHQRKDEGETVTEAVRKLGQRAVALQLDTGNIKGFGTFVSELQSALAQSFNSDRFDFLINNAGTGHHAPFTQMTEENFDTLMNIHFKGVYFLTQQLLPLMNDGGRIINISSGLARFSMPGASAYASMKGAVETMTRYLAKELGARGITANTIAPGAIATDFNGGRVRDDQELNNYVSSITALGRAGVPEDIGGVIAFLCTEEARWINGQRIEVSGGMIL